jgi:SAM-dependent methyltransferase
MTQSAQMISAFRNAREALQQNAAVPGAANRPHSPFLPPFIAPRWLHRAGMLLEEMEFGLNFTTLDLASEGGWISRLLNQMGCPTIYLDVSETSVQRAEAALAADSNCRAELNPVFAAFYGHRFPLADASVDRVVCTKSISAFPNRERILAEAARVLKAGGKAGFVTAEDPEAWLADSGKADLYQYASEWPVAEFSELASQAGFTSTKLQPLPMTPAAMSPESVANFVAGENSAFPIDAYRGTATDSYVIVAEKGASIPDSRLPGRLAANLRVLDCPSVAAGGTVLVARIQAMNTGDTTWIAKQNPAGGFVTVAAILHDQTNRVLERNFARGMLDRDVAPGQTVAIDLKFYAPAAPGLYNLSFGMCCENITWFSPKTGEPSTTTCRLHIK